MSIRTWAWSPRGFPWAPAGLRSWAMRGVGAFKARVQAPAFALAYRWYARQLQAEVASRPLPQHVAMILDGNRRFALQHGLEDPAEGHRFGARKVREVVR